MSKKKILNRDIKHISLPDAAILRFAKILYLSSKILIEILLTNFIFIIFCLYLHRLIYQCV